MKYAKGLAHKTALSGIRIQALLKKIEERQHIDELLPSNIPQNDQINETLSSSSSIHSIDQYQNNKLLAEIRSGVQLRHVVPNEHKQCTEMLYDKTSAKLFIP
ncbi:hypothetical protein LOAG_10794, partial [Loa loa]